MEDQLTSAVVYTISIKYKRICKARDAKGRFMVHFASALVHPLRCRTWDLVPMISWCNFQKLAGIHRECQNIRALEPSDNTRLTSTILRPSCRNILQRRFTPSGTCQLSSKFAAALRWVLLHVSTLQLLKSCTYPSNHPRLDCCPSPPWRRTAMKPKLWITALRQPWWGQLDYGPTKMLVGGAKLRFFIVAQNESITYYSPVPVCIV